MIFPLSPIALVLAAALSEAKLIFEDGMELDVAHFRYFGPRTISPINDAPMIYLTGEAVCNPDPAVVGNKIIISGAHEQKECFVGLNPFAFLKRLHTAGALAFVWLTYQDPPGHNTFIHTDLFPEDHRLEHVPTFEAPVQAIPEEVLDRWRSVKNTNISTVKYFGPPYNDELLKIFTSPFWIFWMRIASPFFSLYTLSLLSLELRRRIRSRDIGDYVGVTLCVLEIPCLVYHAIGMAGGQYGPYCLPMYIHYFAVFTFTGVSTFTSFLVGIKLREMRRSVLGLAQRNLWTYYRFTILTGLVVLVVGEASAGIGIAFLANVTSQEGVFLIFVLISGAQLFAAAYYSIQGRNLSRPLMLYMEHPDSNPRPENERRVRQLVSWINISSLSMALNTTTSTFFLIWVVGGQNSAAASPVIVYVFAPVLLMSFSRIMITFTQVKIVSPFREQSGFSFCHHKCWTCGLKVQVCGEERSRGAGRGAGRDTSTDIRDSEDVLNWVSVQEPGNEASNRGQSSPWPQFTGAFGLGQSSRPR